MSLSFKSNSSSYAYFKQLSWTYSYQTFKTAHMASSVLSKCYGMYMKNCLHFGPPTDSDAAIIPRIVKSSICTKDCG